MSQDFDEVVAGVLEVEPDELTDDAGPDTLGSWTSLRHVQLLVSLQEAYGLSFSYQEMKDVTTIGALRKALRDKGVSV
jgi:acyl carrier protein